MITPLMAQQIKTKNINVVPGQLFCCQWQTHCIDDLDLDQSVTDSDNEFTEYQTPRKISNRLAFHVSAYTHLWKR